jgi:hypothetical protein
MGVMIGTVFGTRVHPLCSSVVLLLTLAGCSSPEVAESHTERPIESAISPPLDFSRPNWLDEDDDCQTTRTEVLVLEAIGPIEFEDDRRCKVTAGSWRCPYTGEWISDPRLLDIDHLVPLKNAWDSGAGTWANGRWREYANDLGQPEHLVAVSASANRSKGARGPDQWLPPLAEYRCVYVRDWATIKSTWKLSASVAEQQAITEALELCERGQAPPLPQDAHAQTPNISAECCKICRKGKACGDSCIASEKTCHVVPGCACDGDRRTTPTTLSP